MVVGKRGDPPGTGDSHRNGPGPGGYERGETGRPENC